MELKDVTTEALSTILTFVKQSGEFVKEQSPLLAQEIIKYNFIISLTAVIVGTILTITSIPLIYLGYNSNTESLQFIFGISGMLCISIGLFIILVTLGTLIKSIFSPRLLVIETLQQKIR